MGEHLGQAPGAAAREPGVQVRALGTSPDRLRDPDSPSGLFSPINRTSGPFVNQTATRSNTEA